LFTRIISVVKDKVRAETTEKAIKNLFDQIKSHPEILTRNEKSEVVYKGNVIPNSSFGDCAKFMFHSKSTITNMNETGLKVFMCALRETKLTHANLTSPDAKRLMRLVEQDEMKTAQQKGEGNILGKRKLSQASSVSTACVQVGQGKCYVKNVKSVKFDPRHILYLYR